MVHIGIEGIVHFGYSWLSYEDRLEGAIFCIPIITLELQNSHFVCEAIISIPIYSFLALFDKRGKTFIIMNNLEGCLSILWEFTQPFCVLERIEDVFGSSTWEKATILNDGPSGIGVLELADCTSLDVVEFSVKALDNGDVVHAILTAAKYRVKFTL